MLGEVSQTTGKQFPKRLILKVAKLSTAAWYDTRARRDEDEKQRPGPKPPVSDDQLSVALDRLLKEPEFTGEGYIKLHKRLRDMGIRVGKTRLYKWMQDRNLLHRKTGNPGSGRAHDGTIITRHPNRMWASDGKEFRTIADGKCWFIGIIDHFNDEIIAFQVGTTFDRFDAIEPLRMAVKHRFGSLQQGVCNGLNLAIRTDHGSQFDSKDYQNELKFLGIQFSPAFVRSPQCNGIIERFHRTLNEQVFANHTFETIEQARTEIQKFIDKYNNLWLLHRLGLNSPVQYRLQYQNQMAKL